MARTTKQVIDWRFRRSRTFNPEGIRTAFRDDSEHHRSVATLASRLCKKCSASSRETYPERSGGTAPLAEKGAWGKGLEPLSPHQHAVAPKRIVLRFRSLRIFLCHRECSLENVPCCDARIC